MPIREVLQMLLDGEPLSVSHAQGVFEDMLGGLLDEGQIASFLTLIQVRGITDDVLVAGANVMRRHATHIPGVELLPGLVLDTCGTGGAPKTFNISTAVAIVVAAAAGPGSDRLGMAAAAGTDGLPARKPVYVAKHGGRSRTGRGSADVLGLLGVNVDASADVQAKCLREAGVCFSFAVHHHPAMKHAAGPRRSLGFATIFNLLGPLTNPGRATHQLLGVYDKAAAETVARALARLGTMHAWVVHGSDGLDEISISGPTHVVRVERANEAGGVEGVATVRATNFDAADYGIARAPLEALSCDDVKASAERVMGVLLGGLESGQKGNSEPCARASRDIVCINAAAALYVAGAARSIEEGLNLAEYAINTGEALRTLWLLRTLSHEA